MNARKTLSALSAAIGLTIILGATLWQRPDAIAPVPLEQLGLAQDHAAIGRAVAQQMQPFFVAGFQEDNTRKNVRLWDWAKRANGGNHLPNYAQEIGDCVSFGAKNAAEYFQFANVGRGTLDATPKLIYPPHIYGGSRVTVGQGRLGCNSDGSIGSWAADWVARYGVLPTDAPGCPKYGGSIAKQWGCKGVPREFVDASKKNLFATVAPVRTADDARDAICNGYPVTIASNFGTRTIDVKDGRRVARGDGSWAHQMCIVGYDGETGSQPYFYVLNSWGPNAHPAPMQGEPPGGFWITASQCQRIVAQDDSFAFSGFDGFPAQPFDLDFTPIGLSGGIAQHAEAKGLAMSDPILTSQGINPDYQPHLTLIGSLFVACGVAFLLGNRLRRLAGGCAAAIVVMSLSTAHAQEVALDFSPLTIPRSEITSITLDKSALTKRVDQVLAEAPVALDFSALTLAAVTPPVVPQTCQCDCSEQCRTYQRQIDELKRRVGELEAKCVAPRQAAIETKPVTVPVQSQPIQWLNQGAVQWRCSNGKCYRVN